MEKMRDIKPGGDTDKDFAMMRMHHQQAVEMARPASGYSSYQTAFRGIESCDYEGDRPSPNEQDASSRNAVWYQPAILMSAP